MIVIVSLTGRKDLAHNCVPRCAQSCAMEDREYPRLCPKWLPIYYIVNRTGQPSCSHV